MASRGSTTLGVTEMKGSWFIWDTIRAHEHWSRWRAPFWHGTRVMSESSHRNYHLGFRCFRDAIGAIGLMLASFELFLLGSLLTGVYMSGQGFYRFAATDTAPDAFKPKAISYVMAGGLLSAVVGPQLVKVTAESMVVPFLGTYLAVIALNLGGMFLFAFLDIPRPARLAKDAPRVGRSRGEMLRNPVIAVSIICATVSYALMNLVMTSSPLAVVGCGFDTNDAANVVSAHVLAMYAPSFFTGHLIARFGVERIVGLGLLILAAAGGVALMGVELEHFFIALILLGLGWNFGFIGATTMLASSHAPSERGRVQGMNDLIVFGGVTSGLAQLRAVDELLGLGCGNRLAVGQPCDASVPCACRGRADLAGAAPAHGLTFTPADQRKGALRPPFVWQNPSDWVAGGGVCPAARRLTGAEFPQQEFGHMIAHSNDRGIVAVATAVIAPVVAARFAAL
jgi:hypothetical protein